MNLLTTSIELIRLTLEFTDWALTLLGVFAIALALILPIPLPRSKPCRLFGPPPLANPTCRLREFCLRLVLALLASRPRQIGAG